MSEVSICNQALGWVGGQLIISLDDDQVEAKLCKANFDALRDAVLEDHAWTFATTRAVLTPIAEDPAFGGGRQFQIPPDCIRVLSVDNTENGFGHLEWAREGQLILADSERIFMRYTARITNTARFSPAFTQALAQRLAADFAIPLAESRQLQENHWALYAQKIADAAATDGMQGRRERRQSDRLTGARSGFYPGSRGTAIGSTGT